MPADSSLAPHFRQNNPGTCLPACARMVLAALGADYSEAQLAKTMGSYEFGTPASRVLRLSELGYEVQYGPLSLDELRQQLASGHFPIAFVRAEFLPWANFDGLHAIVVVEVTSIDVALHDPAQNDGPTRLSVDGFMLA